MKNTTKYQLCKAIVKFFDEYADDVRAALDDQDIIVSLDGSVDGCKPLEAMAAYYGVREVTSIHADDSEFNSIWIAYRE